MDFHLARQFTKAQAIYERLLRAKPYDFQLNHLLGALRQEQGRPGEALELLEKACRLRPLSAPTFMCRGLALDSLGRHADAERSLRAAVGMDPNNFDLWGNLAAHYVIVGRMPEAIDAFKRSIALKPDYAHAWTGLGTALHLSGRPEEGVVCHTRAIELEPRQIRAHFARGQAYQACHCVAEAVADFDAQLRINPDHHQARSFRLFLLNYSAELSPEALFAEHLVYGRAIEAEVARSGGPRNFAGRVRRPGKLRIAFLSPDFRVHSVAFFIEPILRHLDRTRFEILLYHDHFAQDAMTERLRGLADVWRQFAGQASRVVEGVLREDDPDVLVDLAGHTGFNRLDLFAQRAAPVQISYLGYPNTTGLRAVDYRFTDAIADPLGAADQLHTERLVRFAPTAWAYAPPAEAPVPAPAPGGAGAPITFGSFNALSKLSPATIRLWRELLEAVPASRLLVKSVGLVPERWSRTLAAAGLDPARVELRRETAAVADHLALYAQVDVALDPFPYNGTTTSVEALWMGVPLVTLLGDRHAARVGASLLTAIGHPEWIARSPADYVRIAAGLAADQERRRSLRTGLRAELLGSPLMDHRGQAERFGAALEACCEAAFPPARALIAPLAAAIA
jgi:predicted O-linked N-acetylglucosamine transferase (SPINDLY family)